ncbi:MAG TPA: fumarate hydratase [Gammaproteobacteria bacterium]|nr:fumarate hydratase [Gammaproteobacteria bacterium]
MPLIRSQDFIDSIESALQYIACYHSSDFIAAMARAYEREQSPAARDAIAQILTNSRMAAEGHRPLCQDTGIVVVFLRIGMNVRFEDGADITSMVNSGVHKAYTNPDNPLRASVVSPPFGQRINSRDNTPAVIHTTLVPGNKLSITLAAKGGGSENKSHFAILNPSDSVADWVVETVKTMGAGWCPPGILGVGIGGTAEKAMLLAKESLLDPIDIQEVAAREQKSVTDELRLEIYRRVNELGIGAQGLGGITTALDVKIQHFPTHAASLPVALIPNCAATRHIHFELDGSGPVDLVPPSPSDWPDVTWSAAAETRHVHLDSLTKTDVLDWKPGEMLLLSGTFLTGRDAAHKRLVELLKQGLPLPDGVDFHNRFIYYVGPVDPVGDEVVGPAGPTTSSRMDKFTETMLSRTGLLGMIGKAERGQVAIDAIKRHQAVYLIATGGAAYLVSRAIKAARVVAFKDLGMEAIYAFTVENMPVTVAVDHQGNSIHKSGPDYWQNKIAGIPIKTT